MERRGIKRFRLITIMRLFSTGYDISIGRFRILIQDTYGNEGWRHEDGQIGKINDTHRYFLRIIHGAGINCYRVSILRTILFRHVDVNVDEGYVSEDTIRNTLSKRL